MSVTSEVHVSVLKNIASDQVYAASVVYFDEFKQKSFAETIPLICNCTQSPTTIQFIHADTMITNLVLLLLTCLDKN